MSSVVAESEPVISRESCNLIERVNRLYHEQAASRFDRDHRARHRVESTFWKNVGQRLFTPGSRRRTSCTIVDLACGNGFVLEQLAPFLTPQDRPLGIDLSLASLSIARRKTCRVGLQHAAYIAASGTRLPLQDQSVDLLTINASLHHFARPADALMEMNRVLRPGGHLAIGFEPNAAYFATPHLRRVGATIDRIRWYTSPRQNWRRLTQRISGPLGHAPAATSDTDEAIASRIARQLVTDRLSREELPPARVLDMLDAHARGPGAGLCLSALIDTALPKYTVLDCFTTDYLGAAPRLSPLLRSAADRIGRFIDPRQGSLISCVLRKPEDA